MKARAGKVLLWVGGILGLLVMLAAGFLWLQMNYVHQHCIKNTGLGFRTFATDNNDAYPVHTNGFGDALLMLVRSNYLDIRHITAPGDNGKMYEEALKSGEDVPEEKCSRVYVQGVNEKSPPGIALVFDRKSTPGGDHFRSPWGRRQRELIFVDGSMKVIEDKDWPRFASNQVKLLIEAGFERPVAESYYREP